jgi:SAM-dependent methyltransferase
MSTFQDLFSNHAACYARARPRYSSELFAYLATLVPQRKLAWDVGTGNGQAAIGLAEHFELVIATDASAGQIAHAIPHQRVEYRVATAEAADLEPGSVDLVTVAQALHWLNLDAFYANVRRVARPHGVIAAWCYTLPRVSDGVDAVCDRFYRDVVGPYWDAGRRYIDERYETIPFPFNTIVADSLKQRRDDHQSRDRKAAPGNAAARVGDRKDAASPDFECREDWTLREYIDYLESWSAVHKFRKEKRTDPLDAIRTELSAAWGGPEERKTVTWPIYLRVGRILAPQERRIVATGASP